MGEKNNVINFHNIVPLNLRKTFIATAKNDIPQLPPENDHPSTLSPAPPPSDLQFHPPIHTHTCRGKRKADYPEP